jgi:hypothetical protein
METAVQLVLSTGLPISVRSSRWPAHQSILDTTYMPIKARPFGCQEQFDWGADIHSVSYDGTLSIRVLRNRNRDDGIEVTFSQVDGFRLLDEVTLAEYWIAEDFPSGYPVLEVFDGGWAKEEDKRLGYTQSQREWIIVTAGACVSVFSRHEPKIRDAVHPRATGE